MTTLTQPLSANRLHKSRIFTMIFSNKKELLELYNAISGKNYTDPELLEVNTLENAIYMSMQNDLSFLIDSRLSLYEHQSTYNPNLPLRYLLYLSDLYSAMTKEKNFYGQKLIKLPAPNFIIFYNGEQPQPDFQILKLSDAYTVAEENPSLELKAIMLNINPGHNTELLAACKSLRDYSEYTSRVRKYSKIMATEDAVERAITECIQEDILKDFLERNRLEAKSMSIYEYDQEEHLRLERNDAKEEGRKEGRKEGSSIAQTYAVQKLSHTMTPSEISKILEYDKAFVLRVIELSNTHPDSDAAEISQMLNPVSLNHSE